MCQSKKNTKIYIPLISCKFLGKINQRLYCPDLFFQHTVSQLASEQPAYAECISLYLIFSISHVELCCSIVVCRLLNEIAFCPKMLCGWCWPRVALWGFREAVPGTGPAGSAGIVTAAQEPRWAQRMVKPSLSNSSFSQTPLCSVRLLFFSLPWQIDILAQICLFLSLNASLRINFAFL